MTCFEHCSVPETVPRPSLTLRQLLLQRPQWGLLQPTVQGRGARRMNGRGRCWPGGRASRGHFSSCCKENPAPSLSLFIDGTDSSTAATGRK